MKRFTLFCLLSTALLFAAQPTKAQLPTASRNSAATMVYRLSYDDLKQLHLKDKQPSEKMLHTFVLSYTGSKCPALERGNYLLASASEGRMYYREIIEDELDEILVLGGGKPRLVLTDTLDGFISSARIAGWKWDARTNCYTTSRPKFDKTYEINNNGVYHYFTISEEYHYYWREHRPSWFSRQWSTVKSWFKKSPKPTDRWEGFMVFSKPKYKPGETVRLKAYLTRNDAQYNETVNLVLSRPSQMGGDTILSRLTPYRAGMYSFEFALTEKLKLQLDRSYLVLLRTTDNRLALLNDYFTYEEYELKSLNFTAQMTHSDTYLANEPVDVRLRATDENGLPVYDGRVEITLTPQRWSNGNALAPLVFVADTLWHQNIDMEGFAERRVTIPTDAFPAKYTGGYQIHCVFMTADNERREQFLSFYRNGDERYQRPHVISPPTVHFERDKEQVTLSFENPDTLPVWYRVLVGEKLIDEGFGRQPSEISRTYPSQKNSFSLQYWYMMNDVDLRFENRILPYISENITMTVSAPQSIYPGQRVEIGVDVVDNRGRAVPNADVTAYAYTSKFENSTAVRPLRLPLKYVMPQVKSYDIDELYYSETVKLDWTYWRERLGLDSMEFYRFLSPDPIYRYTEKIGGDMSELMPFAVVDGEAVGVQVLYIDSQPYFIKGSTGEHYAFRVRPGYHNIIMRLPDRQVGLNLTVLKGERLICSINGTKTDYNAGIDVALYDKKQRGKFAAGEHATLSNYVFQIAAASPYTNFYRTSVAEPLYIFGGQSYADITNINKGSILVGPFPYNLGNQMRLLRNGNEQINWFDMYGGRYDYRVDNHQVMVFQRPKSVLPERMTNYRPTFSFRERPITDSMLFNSFEERVKTAFTSAAGAANLHTDISYRRQTDCRLMLHFGRDASREANLQPMLLRLVTAGDTLVYYGYTTSFTGLPAGEVQLTALFRNNTWYTTTLNLKKGGTNYASVEWITPLPANEMSAALYASVRNVYTQRLRAVDFSSHNGYYELDESVVSVGYGVRMRGASSLYGSRSASMDMVVQDSSADVEYKEVANELAGQVAGLSIDKEEGGDVENSTIQFPPMPDLDGRDPSAGVRHNFADDAFWQPRLATNQQGHTSFEVTFPDDITQWRAQFVAIGTPKQTAQKTVAINSFLPLSARLSVPNFAVAGDRFNAIGKLTSYSDDTVRVVANGREVSFVRTLTEPLAAVATGDSITLEYMLMRADGYSDGERRTIPVYPQGTLEARGEFVVLENSTHTFATDTVQGKVTVHAEATQLGSLLAEIDRTVGYVYNCNEQMASKIKSLVSRRRIGVALGRTFDDDTEMRKLVSQLLKNRNPEGLWGWWGKSTTEWWLSAHVIEALSQAQEEGYAVGWNVGQMTTVMMTALQTRNLALSDRVLVMLRNINAAVDYQTLYEALPELPKDATLAQRLARLQTRAAVGLADAKDGETVVKWATASMFGGLAWSEKPNPQARYYCPSPEYGTVENTLMAYRILAQVVGTEAVRAKIRLYLFEQRRTEGWGNTYQTSRIIETILPDLYTAEMRAQHNVIRNPSLTVNGKTITKFPYTAEFEGGAPIVASGKGSAPIYLTVYQQTWNSAPEAVSADFTVTSRFLQNGKEVTSLTAGEPVDLVVTVVPRAQASYIMISIPIPAGCSYTDHYQNWWGEIHREYFKEQVSIFVSSMTVPENDNRYTYVVHLTPRYTGTYTLNPARAELMYFPTFFGRTGLEELRIEN